ncbi:M23 family metallopeptidase [Arthrobacter sp. MDT2-2]
MAPVAVSSGVRVRQGSLMIGLLAPRPARIPVRIPVRTPVRAGCPARVFRAALRRGCPGIVTGTGVPAIMVLVLALVLAGNAAVPAGAAADFVPEWSWPLTPVPEVLRPFEKPPQPWKRGHRGVDLSGGVGGPVIVLSPADGVVSFAGIVVDRGVLSIDHGGGRISSFEPVSTDLVKGGRVGRGDAVAILAGPAAGVAPGHCGQPCLHWGVRVDGYYVDPLSFVMDRRPSVLLPLDGGRSHREAGRGRTVPVQPLRRRASPRRRRRCP